MKFLEIYNNHHRLLTDPTPPTAATVLPGLYPEFTFSTMCNASAKPEEKTEHKMDEKKKRKKRKKDKSDKSDTSDGSDSGPCWSDYERTPGTKEGEKGSCRPKGSKRKK